MPLYHATGEGWKFWVDARSITQFSEFMVNCGCKYSHERRRIQMNPHILRLNNTHILWVRLQMAD
jgi:glycyl-tRNA synthetase alpha subunit